MPSSPILPGRPAASRWSPGRHRARACLLAVDGEGSSCRRRRDAGPIRTAWRKRVFRRVLGSASPRCATSWPGGAAGGRWRYVRSGMAHGCYCACLLSPGRRSGGPGDPAVHPRGDAVILIEDDPKLGRSIGQRLWLERATAYPARLRPRRHCSLARATAARVGPRVAQPLVVVECPSLLALLQAAEWVLSLRGVAVHDASVAPCS